MKPRTGLSAFAYIALASLPFLAQGAETGPTVPLADDDRQAIEQYLGKGFVGEAVPAPAIEDATHYLMPESGTRIYRLVAGPDKGKTQQHRPVKLKREGGESHWRYETGGNYIYYIDAQADGNYVVTGVTDTDQGAITQYSPPEPFMLQGLSAGEERKETLGVKVFDLSDPSEQTHEGSMEVTYRYVGAYKVKVPAGSFDSVLMKWTFKGKVGPASIDDTQYRFFASNVGMVAGIEQMDVSAVLVYNRHIKIARVLVSKPK